MRLDGVAQVGGGVAGRPVTAATTRSRSRPIRASRVRKNSPVPTNSCQRASTSPRSNRPSFSPCATVRCAPGTRPGPGRPARRRRPPARRRRRRALHRGCSAASAPSRVCRTTAARASASAASRANQSPSGAVTRSGSRPWPSTQVSGRTNSGAAPRLLGGEHLGQVGGDLVGGLRRHPVEHHGDRGPAGRAVRSSSHGTASAYRAAVVTKSQRSAAASSWPARARLASTTESMSGASRKARPGWSAGAVTSCRVPGSSLGLGWCGSGRAAARPGGTRRSRPGCRPAPGTRVVGRSTPAALTRAWTRLLTRVDLPAPVEPPTTTSSGASSRASRGSR